MDAMILRDGSCAELGPRQWLETNLGSPCASKSQAASTARDEQLQVTTQAQAAQLIAAAGQGKGLNAQSRRLAERVALKPITRPVPGLPQLTILDQTIPKERHLLTALHADWQPE